MGQLFQSPKIISQVTAKDGECTVHVTLDLNINLSSGVVAIQEKEKKQEDEVQWAIPDFKSNDKVKFGKKELQ